MRLPILIPALALSLLAGACGGGKTDTDTGTEPETGEMHRGTLALPARDSLHTGLPFLLDSSLHYALYIPARADTGTLRVMYFFDPHADPRVPLEKYRTLADSTGYVLMGSHDCRNGLTGEMYERIGDAFFGEMYGRYGLAPRRSVLAGFSGGSRVASNFALSRPGFSGVIGCSGGLPPVEGTIQARFDYYGLTGNGDFNYGEMIVNDQMLQTNNLPHYLEIFEGKHEWPPLSSLFHAVEWLDLQAMKNGQASLDPLVVEGAWNRWKAENAALESAGKHYERVQLCERYATALESLRDISDIRTAGAAAREHPSTKKMTEEIAKLEEDEIQKQQAYSEALVNEEMGWWKDEKNKLEQRASGKGIQAQQAQRLLGFLGIVAFSYSNQAIQKQDMDKAPRFTDVYRMIEPENEEAWYLSAVVAMLTGKNDAALNYLEKAVSLGFADRKRLETEVAFSGIRTDARYQTLLNNLKPA